MEWNRRVKAAQVKKMKLKVVRKRRQKFHLAEVHNHHRKTKHSDSRRKRGGWKG